MDNIAQTILHQLGGNKFIVMTGAKNFLQIERGLLFSLPGRNFAKAGINRVRINFDPNDTYSIKFMKLWGNNITLICEFEDIYDEDLQKIFTRETGLDTYYIYQT